MYIIWKISIRLNVSWCNCEHCWMYDINDYRFFDFCLRVHLSIVNDVDVYSVFSIFWIARILMQFLCNLVFNLYTLILQVFLYCSFILTLLWLVARMMFWKTTDNLVGTDKFGNGDVSKWMKHSRVGCKPQTN